MEEARAKTSKICNNCKFYKQDIEFLSDYVCENSKSNFAGDWKKPGDTCELYEENEKAADFYRRKAEAEGGKI